MSLSIQPITPIKVLEPRVAINNKRYYALLEGGSTVTVKDFTTTSASNSNFIFTCPPPNPNIIVDRKVYLQTQVTLTFTGQAAVGQRLLVNAADAFRAYPLSSCMQTLQVTLNNQSVSLNVSDVIQGLLRYHTPQKQREFDYSMTPSMLDQYQEYSDGFGEAPRNPLAKYGDGYEMNRGGFSFISITNSVGQGIGSGSPTVSAIVVALLTEPIYLSPFLFGHGDHSGFLGLQTMDFNINWSNNLSYMWSHDAVNGNPISNIVVSFAPNPKLLFQYITPKQLMPLPPVITYPYFEIQRYPTQSPAMAPNSTYTIASQNIQLQSIPRRMYIYARRQNSDQTFSTTDTFFSIQNVSINWNNNSGLLASASAVDLYNISRTNGCNLSWTQWNGITQVLDNNSNAIVKGTVGSILCIEFGKDLGLPDDQCPGLLGTYQLQMNVTVTNTNQINSVTPTLYVVVVNEGTFTITHNSSATQIGVMSKQDIMDARQMRGVDYNVIKKVYGGDWLDDISRFGSMLWSGIKTVANDVADFVPKALNVGTKVAPLLGLGDDEMNGGVLIGDGMSGGCNGCCNGGARVGGKMITRKQLKSRMR